MRGECILTGAEYLLAKRQGCRIDVDEVFRIPFEGDQLAVGEVSTRIRKSGGEMKLGDLENTKSPVDTTTTTTTKSNVSTSSDSLGGNEEPFTAEELKEYAGMSAEGRYAKIKADVHK